ncbi:DUF885 domain-containing protein [Kangiella sediminilitoris]|uniref:Lipoprotein n=1 Tax=Kangiella sediminilitoris TaxID=1144748 RepID=A0A1B3BC79_9GAMM|nr:DUF885 domain-containing protein [Kangiella sediminilitoris]AOE50410.1 hypothetical protein KS2013_1700 [Kangiella sediminilitoris]
MKSTKFQLTAVALAVLLTACNGEEADKKKVSTAVKVEQATAKEKPAENSKEQQMTEAEKASAIYEAYWEENLKMNPLSATFMGDHRFNDRLGDFGTEKGRAEALAFSKKYLSKIQEIDESQLEGQALLSYQIFKNDRQAEIAGAEFPDYMQPIQQFYNPFNFFAMLGSGQSAQPFNTVKDYENWLSRMEEAYTGVDVIIKNMRTGMESGVVQPKALMVKVVPQLKAHMVDDVEESLFYTPIKNIPEDFSEEDKKRLTDEYVKMIETMVVPMYTKMHDFIKDEYIPAARETAGMIALPNGKEWYAFKVKQTTSTELTPDEIHQIGLDEVARIHGEMQGVMDEVGFEGTLQEFFEFTKNDPKFIFETKEDMLQAYENLREKLDETAPDLFKVIPKAQFEIRAVEAFREQSASAASYQRPAPDGSRPGIFYVNTYDLSARPTWTVESLYLHEAVPGHHFQISTQQELKDIPDFRRFGGTTAYIEGWGLYSESLGKEMGVYTDPYQYYGALSAELWRAIRLVVDTGLHAKGWTREEVLDYMEKNSAAAKARRVSEAERFMAIPSQALAYKIGQLKIRELRTLAETELGEDFDVREFHYQVLKDGALPLNILENKIKKWIENQKA